MAYSSLTPEVLTMQGEYKKNQHWRQPLVSFSTVSQDTSSLCWIRPVMFLFTTRGRFCLSVLLHPVHTLPSKSGPVFSSYPDMQRVPHVHTKNRVPLSSRHLAWNISGGLARSKRDFHSEASTYLSHNDRLTTSMLYLVTLSPLHLFFYTFVHLTYSRLLHPFCLCPWGVSFTLYMPRQLHNSPLRAQVTD